MSDYNSFNWHWIVAGDETRYWSSAAGSYVAKLPEGAGVTRIASEAELWDVLADQAPLLLPNDDRRRQLRTDPDRVDMLQRLRSATPSQIDSYIDTNVTNLAQARSFLKKLTKVLALAIRE